MVKQALCNLELGLFELYSESFLFNKDNVETCNVIIDRIMSCK